MSEFRVNSITNQEGSAGPQVCGVSTFSGKSGFRIPSGSSDFRRQDGGGRGRGVFCGGYYPTQTNIIDAVQIATLGNSADFGDLITYNRLMGSLSSSVRGVIGGGYPTTNLIQYVTISSSGGANDFGDLSSGADYGLAGASNNTTGLFLGGDESGNTIDFITIATLGDSSDFGTMSRRHYGNACSSPTRVVFGGGEDQVADANTSSILSIEIATKGDSTDFGSLTAAKKASYACASSTRGIFAGGLAPADIDNIDFITIATKGNASDFGDLTEAKHNYGAGTSSQTRGIFAGTEKYSPQTYNNTIEFITIATTGNAADFGDITQKRGQNGDFSDAHGGLAQ